MNRKLADYISNKMGIKVANCEIENIDCFKGYKFDVIYHRNVLSHLYDPLEVFNVLNAKLKEDGVLIFETGNFGRLSKLWLKLIGKIGYPEHLYHFSQKAVKKLLKHSNFELVECRNYSIVLYSLLSKLLGEKHKNKKENFITNRKHNYVSFSDKIKGYMAFLLVYYLGRFCPVSWPSTMIFVAKKYEKKL